MVDKVVRLVCPEEGGQETQGMEAKERGVSREGCPDSKGCALASNSSGKGSQPWWATQD